MHDRMAGKANLGITLLEVLDQSEGFRSRTFRQEVAEQPV
jgi:hypothetical protein